MRKLFLLALIFCTIQLSAQRYDFQTWWSASLSGELLNAIDYEISPGIRLNQNSTAIKSTLINFDLSYPVNKYFRIGSKYRFQNKFYYNNVDYLANRFSVYGQVRYKIKRFRLRYRGMYQWEYLGIKTREFGDIPIQEYRHKFQASYYRKRWDLRPVVSTEFFFTTKPEFIISEKKYRLTAGASYKINKSMNLGLYYRYQHEFFANNPWKIHVISTKLDFSL